MNDNTLVPSDQRAHATGQAGAGSSSLIGAAPCADEAATSMAVPPGGTENSCEGALWRMCRVRADSPPSGSSSLLGAWDDLAEREQKLGIAPGHIFLLRPDGWPDRDVLAYLNSGSFRRLALQTQESYATDLKVHLSFLASQGVDWHDATVEDYLKYERWRRRDSLNAGQVGGAKFARELAAHRRFFEWQADHGAIRLSPIEVDEVRRPDGSVGTVARLRPSNARTSRVNWLTPRAYRRFRDVGMGGYGADGGRDGSWRGRNDVRNTAFTDLLWSSGLRLREAATLLSLELPTPYGDARFVQGRVGEAAAKGASRVFWVAAQALRAIEGYRDSTRAAAVRRAQREGRYTQLDGVMVVVSVTKNRQIALRDERGVSGRVSLDALSAEDRRRLFVEADGALEPAMVWLTEAGMPMPYRTWQKTFAVASARCASQGVDIECHPHKLRHSFALRMLMTLTRAFDRRLELTPGQRAAHSAVIADPFVWVQTLLGHRSRDTTESIYLEPVKGLQIEMFLNGDDGDEEASALLSNLALTSGLVQDDPR